MQSEQPAIIYLLSHVSEMLFAQVFWKRKVACSDLCSKSHIVIVLSFEAQTMYLSSLVIARLSTAGYLGCKNNLYSSARNVWAWSAFIEFNTEELERF